MKTRKSVTKRFKVTGTGKVMKPKCGKSHRMVSFTGKRVRQLRGKSVVGNKRRAKKLLRAMQMG